MIIEKHTGLQFLPDVLVFLEAYLRVNNYKPFSIEINLVDKFWVLRIHVPKAN